MKLPNGYGSVYRLPGNRRKPWTARITLGKETTANGRQRFKYRYLGYCETQEEALALLAKYHEDPFALEGSQITFAELFEKWSGVSYPTVSKSSIKCHNAAYKLCGELYDMKFREIRKIHMQHVIDTCDKNYSMLTKIKTLLGHLYRFAMENDLCNKDYSEYVTVSQHAGKNPNKIERIPFTDQELAQLWECQQSECVQIILMMIYSGMRLGEIRDLKKENVDIENRCFSIIDAKTAAGVRVSPIARKVLPFFQEWMSKPGTYFLTTEKARHYTDGNFRRTVWNHVMNQLSMQHLPHDTRHTCITLLATAGVDDRIIKRIVGHAGNGVTGQVYTHFDMESLLKAIDMI